MARSASSLQRSLRAQDGVALVEFALVLPILLVLLFGMLDFGRVFNYWIDATHLSNEGARWAVVNTNPAASGSLQTFIQQQADTEELKSGGTSAVPSPLQVCITFPNGASTVGNPVRVTATVEYHWLPFLSNWALGGLASTTVSSSSTMRLEASPTNYSEGCT